MTAPAKVIPYPSPADEERDGLPQWLVTTDHKRIGLLILGTSLVLFYEFGALAMTMRSQLAFPSQHLLGNQAYNQIFTMHGTGMIALVVTPIAFGLGVYLVPLMIGAPTIAAPRVTLLGYWLYVVGALALLLGAALPGGAASGWWGYTPLANGTYSPGAGMNLWVIGVSLAACGMLLLSGTVAWTILTRRAPGMTMMHMPVFCWSMLVTCLMGLTAFPSLLSAMATAGARTHRSGRVHGELLERAVRAPVLVLRPPSRLHHVLPVHRRASWRVAVHLRRHAASSATRARPWPCSAFAAGVDGGVGAPHVRHRPGGQRLLLADLDLLMRPGRDRVLRASSARCRADGCATPTPMLFALAFIPQFLIGGLTGILVADPAIDYHAQQQLLHPRALPLHAVRRQHLRALRGVLLLVCRRPPASC